MLVVGNSLEQPLINGSVDKGLAFCVAADIQTFKGGLPAVNVCGRGEIHSKSRNHTYTYM